MSCKGAILGIDPGIANLGYAILSKPTRSIITSGVHVTKKKKQRHDIYRRIQEQSFFICNLLETYPITTIVFEKPIGSRYAIASQMTYSCVGLLFGIATSHGIPIFSYTPTQLKQTAEGTKTSSKNSLIKYITKIGYTLSSPKYKQEHECDAILALLTHLRQEI